MNAGNGDANPNSKSLLKLEPFQFEGILRTHIDTNNYVLEEKPNKVALETAADISYGSSAEIWKDIIDNPAKIKRTDRVYTLENFYLFEWFPRSPGLYFTPIAGFAREQAKDRVIGNEDGYTIYDPYGKQSMLEGGVGNIRLKPITIRNEDYYFMSASSGISCHQGFPVAIPEPLYNTVIEEICEKGAVLKNLTGRLKIIPDEIENVYASYSEVPKVYLMIDSVNEPTDRYKPRDQSFSVTVATSFISDYEDQSKIYATYVGFDPSGKGTFKESIEWLEQDYVVDRYRGKILTDFDQTINHFKNAPFSLEKVMTQTIDEKDLATLQNIFYVNPGQVIPFQNAIKQYIRERKQAQPPVIFISYNHQDVQIAEKLSRRFVGEGFTVIWDVEKIRTGENIESFITDSVRKSSFTVSVISENSIQSAWVAMETILNRYAEIFKENRFLPVYIDTHFFDSNFINETLNQLDEKVFNLDRLIADRLTKRRGIEDLQEERTRLNELIHQLPSIVRQLKQSACTDISEPNFETGINKIIRDINLYHKK